MDSSSNKNRFYFLPKDDQYFKPSSVKGTIGRSERFVKPKNMEQMQYVGPSTYNTGQTDGQNSKI